MDPMETQTSPEIGELTKQHHQYDRQLSELASRPYLSPEEELEETRLKKLKLAIKDRMRVQGSGHMNGIST